MFDDIDPRAHINDEPNPFTPVYYDDRLNAPPKRPTRTDVETPMRPGQIYTGAYDKLMNRPAPLAPIGGARESAYRAEGAYGMPEPSEPLRFHEPVLRAEAEPGFAYDYGTVGQAAAPDIPGYLRKAPRLTPLNSNEGEDSRRSDDTPPPPSEVHPLFQRPLPAQTGEPTAPPAQAERRSRSQSRAIPERRRRADRREPDEAFTAEYLEPLESPAWEYPYEEMPEGSPPDTAMPLDDMVYTPPQTQPDPMAAEYHEPIESPVWEYPPEEMPEVSPPIPPQPEYIQYVDQPPVFNRAYEPGYAGFAPDGVESYLAEQPVVADAIEPLDEIASFFNDGEAAAPVGEPIAPDAADYAPIAGEAPAPVADTGRTKPTEPAPPPDKAPKAPKPRIRVWRLLALISIVAMIAFVLIAGGSILSDLARNKQEMNDFREDYRKQMGVSPEQDGDMVALLPYGQTYAPTATPYAAPTASPDSGVPVVLGDTGAQGGASSDGTPSTIPPRTRLNSYPDNPLRNVLPDIAELRKENPDISGRLVIPGVLDEIVVQRNNTFYLTHNYRGVAAAAGAVFIDESCSLKTPPENLLLRGQDVEEDKAFAPLWRFSTGGSAFVSGATRARLTTLYEEAEYVLFAVIVTSAQSAQRFNYAGCPSFSTDEEMLAHVDDAMRQSLYKFNVTVDASDRLLTLATLGSGDKTLVLMYRMVRAGERSR